MLMSDQNLRINDLTSRLHIESCSHFFNKTLGTRGYDGKSNRINLQPPSTDGYFGTAERYMSSANTPLFNMVVNC